MNIIKTDFTVPNVEIVKKIIKNLKTKNTFGQDDQASITLIMHLCLQQSLVKLAFIMESFLKRTTNGQNNVIYKATILRTPYNADRSYLKALFTKLLNN